MDQATNGSLGLRINKHHMAYDLDEGVCSRAPHWHGDFRQPITQSNTNWGRPLMFLVLAITAHVYSMNHISMKRHSRNGSEHHCHG